MSLSVTTLRPTIGARIEGVDVSRALAAETVEELRSVLPRFGVLVLRRQAMDDARLVEFGRAFGDLELLPEPNKRESGLPQIFDLTNVKSNGGLVEFDDEQSVFIRGSQRWHTDSSFRAIPCLASMLLAVEVPEGSSTQFADMYAAFEALPEARQRDLTGLRVVHSYEYSRANNPGKLLPMDRAERAKLPPVEHPLVRTHPDGRRSLYLGAHASHIVGRPPADGRALLDELLVHATDSRFVYEHQWRVGDLVIWDNRCTLHRLRPYDITRVRRVMRRITVAGIDPPV